ncbi:hypothetical protein Syun_007984 [Stephania yunnanensis]|uniref:Bet v I/Major latex protein domain-containing protein n=1 Tax=Stephania yunnanensis TaxID=152371 RepID=A0AAP0L0W5_9MAGN
MGVHTYTGQFESPVSPARLFKGCVLHLHEIAPKVVPGVVKSGALIEGDGGAGSIKEYHFTDVVPFKHVRERVEELDKEKHVCKYSVAEGGTLGTNYKAATHTLSFEPTPSGGSVCKVVGEVHGLEGTDFTEQDEAQTKEGILGTLKAVDAYLQANPDVYA